MKNKRKSGFLLFWFSLLPGAGEMYLGFMRQGLSLMGLFWGVIALSAWLELGPFLLVLPILFFYSFFHSHNLFKLPDDQFYRVPDTFLFSSEEGGLFSGVFKRFHSGIAIIFILLGISILWHCFLDVLYWILPSFLYDFFSNLTNLVPRIAAGLLIIAMGLYFIRGKKQDLSKHTNWDYPEEEPEPQDWGYHAEETPYEAPYESPFQSTASQTSANQPPVKQAAADQANSYQQTNPFQQTDTANQPYPTANQFSTANTGNAASMPAGNSQIELVWPEATDNMM